MRTLFKLLISMLILISFSACFPVFVAHGHRGEGEGEGRWYYNNHYYGTRIEYRNARREGRRHENRSDYSNNDNHDNNNNGNQREGR